MGDVQKSGDWLTKRRVDTGKPRLLSLPYAL